MDPKKAIASLVDKIRRKHLALQTERTYSHWLRRYIGFLKTDRHGGDSRSKVERFLTHLAREGVAASTQNQAFNAILFFYREVLEQELGEINALRAKRPVYVRQAPAREDVARLLATVRDRSGQPIRLIVGLLYGCGLRVNEPLNLRIKDIDLANSRLFIRGAKGGKDRVVSIPCSLTEPIRAQMLVASAKWEQDQQTAIPVPLPGRLEEKYPRHAFTRAWYWLFPANGTCRHPRTGKTVRWRCHEANVQRAVKDAARTIGLDGTITPHHLRHAYASHLLESGVNPRAIQLALGHSSLETTMAYTHSDSTSIANPLDQILAACTSPARPLQSPCTPLETFSNVWQNQTIRPQFSQIAPFRALPARPMRK